MTERENPNNWKALMDMKRKLRVTNLENALRLCMDLLDFQNVDIQTLNCLEAVLSGTDNVKTWDYIEAQLAEDEAFVNHTETPSLQTE